MLTGMVGIRIGARKLLLTGLFILGIASFVGAWVVGGGMLLAMRVVEGVGFAAIVSAAPKIIFDAAEPKDRDLALGIWSTYMPAGMTIAMVVSSFLIEPLGWRGVWLISAGSGLAVAILVLVGMKNSQWPEQARTDISAVFDWDSVRATLGSRALWLYSGAFILFTVQWSALVVATNVAGNLIGAWLLHRGVARWLLLVAANLLMGVTGALILAGFIPDAAKIPLAIIFSTGSGVLPAAAFSGAAVHAPKPDLIAMASGLLAQGAAIGKLLGPPLMAIVVGGLGSWENAWWCMLICPVAGLVLTFGIFLIERISHVNHFSEKL